MATKDQQNYLDKAEHYVDRAALCYSLGLWPEAANHLGSALESLLRIRYGNSGKSRLVDLVEKFDEDPLFNNIIMHDGFSQQCTTCFADRARILRNSVHPNSWIEAVRKDVDDTSMLVLLIYHTLVKCSSKVADFHEAPNSALSNLEATSKLTVRSAAFMDKVHLGRAFTYLSKAMREMCTSTDDLRTRWMKATESHLGGSSAKDFPEGLKHRFSELAPSLGQVPESEDAAKTLIERLVSLHDDSELAFYEDRPGA